MTPLSVALLRALEGLPSANRDALLLARQGSSFAQIAEQLGASVEHVRAWVLHAVQSLTQVRLALTPA
jgi:DNA-directed RNA polymerase specialized sigma24 family protein